MVTAGRMNAGATIDDVAGAIDREGYAIVEHPLTPSEAKEKRAELTRILAETPVGRNDFEGFKTRRIYALFAKTRTFDAPATHPVVLAALDRVLGHYQLSAPAGIEIGPGETAQNLHTDDIIYPVKKPHQHLVLNTMWALDDFTEANGATRVAPGSHRWWPNVRPEDAHIVRDHAGGVRDVLHRQRLSRGRREPERQAPTRHDLEYVSGWLRPQENHILAVPRDIVRTLSPRLQELLGYNIHPPFVGYVDGRHRAQTLE